MLQEVKSFQEFIDEGVYDPGILKAFFTAGGAGSGKSYVAKKSGLGKLSPLGIKVVNSDVEFEKLMKDANLDTTPDNIFSAKGQELRNRAKEVTQSQKSGYVDGRLGLLIDGTGKNAEKVIKQAKQLESLGYDTYILFVDTSLDVALERNKTRARSLKDEFVEKMWHTVQATKKAYQSFFGSNYIYINNDSAGQDELMLLFKKISKLVKAKVKNPIGKKWIKDELAAKNRLNK